MRRTFQHAHSRPPPVARGSRKEKTKPAVREISRNLQEVSKKETSKNNRLIKNSQDRNTNARHNGTAQEDPNRTRMRYSTQKALMMICWPRSKHVVVAVRLMSAWPANVINHLRIADTTDTTDGGGGGGGGGGAWLLLWWWW